MERVSVHHIVAAPVDELWDTIVDIAAYPDYMDEVESVTITEDDPELGRVAEWVVLLRGSSLKWTERGLIDREAWTITFTQLDGDLAAFEGHWSLKAQSPDTTSVEFEVEFEIGIPLLERMLTPIARDALDKNARAMIGQVEERVRHRALGPLEQSECP